MKIKISIKLSTNLSESEKNALIWTLKKSQELKLKM